MSVIDKIKLDGTTYDVGKTPDTTLAVSGSPADAAKVGTELSKKVDKVTGKGLSTNDFTTPEKTKLAGIAEKATAVAIDATLTQNGQAADAKVVGDKLAITEEALSTKAEIDGSYESMTVGNAEQLISSRYTVDNEPYLYRTSGGTADIGDREYDEIVGGSVVWNQDCGGVNTQWFAQNGAVINNTTDNIMDVTFPQSQSVQIVKDLGSRTPDSSHVYLSSVDVKLPNTDGGYITLYGGFVNALKTANPLISEWQKIIGVAKRDTYRYFIIRNNSAYNLEHVLIKNPMHIDLTKMFGSEIADYVYNLEQTTEGAGVAWFKKLFPNDYYTYNAGEMMYVSGLSSHEMVGFNQWDEEWELGGIDGTTGKNIGNQDRIRSKNYIPVLPQKTYYLGYVGTFAPSFYVCYYDTNKNFIERLTHQKNKTITIPSGCRYIRFFLYTSPSQAITTYNHDICINLSWPGWRNGEYEPYVKHSYPLDPSLTLRGVPKLSADGKLYFDGDRYASDGTVTRRYGLVDLGTLTWIYYPNDTYFYAIISNRFKNGVNGGGVCNNYAFAGTNKSSEVSNLSNKSFMFTSNSANNYIYIRDDSYTDAASFKAAVSGVWLVYELAEPTTETALPYQSPQIVDDFGTEEYVSTSIVPVGHETKYLANLRDKIQHLPDLADSDGYYVIQQTGHDMSLVHFRIPQAPTTDGEYTLKAKVSGGTPTYTWEGVTTNEG